MTSKIVFIGICIICIGLAYYFPESVIEAASTLTKWFVNTYGGIVLVICTAFLCSCIALLLLPCRNKRIGGQHAVPQYSTISWLTMLFATGMGSGLVFYGAAEPLIHYVYTPPDLTKQSNAQALGITYFHWAFHAWAIYAIAGLSIAYIGFAHNNALTPAASLKQQGCVAKIVNYIAMIAIIFGIVGSLCMTILQISDGISRQFHFAQTDQTWVKFSVLGSLCLVFILSSCTGLRRGIKILSNINIAVALLLLSFIFFATWHISYSTYITQALNEYATMLLTHSLRIFPSNEIAAWQQDWSITLFLWWVAWAPFVSVFIARISYGRTIKEFILGVVGAPTLFSIIWFGILGTAILGDVSLQSQWSALADHPQQVTYHLLNSLPYSDVTIIVMLLLLFVFLVTSADSGAYVLAMFTSHSHYIPTIRSRLIWGVVLGLVTALMILGNSGINIIKSVAILGGIPYLFIMLWQLVILLHHLLTKTSPKERL